jgi:hypothetical protein
MGTGVLSPGVKQLERDGGHSPPSSIEVKYEYSYTSAPSVCLCGLDRDRFTFYIYLIWMAQLWVKYTECCNLSVLVLMGVIILVSMSNRIPTDIPY